MFNTLNYVIGTFNWGDPKNKGEKDYNLCVFNIVTSQVGA